MRSRTFIFILIAIIIIQLINPSGLDITTINAEATNPPDFLISRTMDKLTYNQGDIAKITYNITPTGQYVTPIPIGSDIVIALNIYSGMSASKLSSAKNAAIDFINKVKAANAYNKIGLVAFGYKVNNTIALTDNYDSISTYISAINSTDLSAGSNFQDALEKSQAVLADGKGADQYIVFISDGYPNYFTSAKWLGKYNNENAKYEDGVYYYSDMPKVTKPAYDNATTACNTLADKGIVLYSVGIGTDTEVDMTFLSSMSQATGGIAYQAALPDTAVQVMTQIPPSTSTVKLSGLVIKDKLPVDIAVVNNSAVIPDSLGNISIALPDIIYNSDGTMPSSFSYVLEISLKNAGSYTLDNARIEYLDINLVAESKPINDLSFTVNTNYNLPPGLAISKQISKAELVEGETASLTYTITPMGSFNEGAVRKPLDIVIAIDRSNGMNEDNKLVNSKQKAESLVNVFKAVNQGDRISLVTFDRYSRIEVPLTSDYDTIINSIRQIQANDGSGFDAGTNIEIGLKTAETALTGSTNQKHIVYFSDGVPSYYTDKISTSSNVEYYSYSDYSGYTIKHVKYNNWYYEPSNVNFYGSSMLDYNLQYGEYSLEQGVGHRGYIDAREQASSIKSKGIVLNTVCATGGTDTDLSFMQELASLGGGTAYTTDTFGELDYRYDAIIDGSAPQVLSNITITEALPLNVNIIENPYISIDGRTITINIPDIIFEKDKGTPAPITVSVELSFSTAGVYQLSDISRLDYTSYDGSAGTSINIPMLTVTVIKAPAINGDIKVYDGSKQVSVIRKGKFDTIISFYVVNKGKLNLKLNAVPGSEEMFNSLSTASEVWDIYGNSYKLTKTPEGIFITTDYRLAKGSYEIVVKCSIGNIIEKSYYLQLDFGAEAANPSIRVDVVAMPILL